MEQTQLTVELRTATGKGICRRLRSQGRIPGVVYGKGIESVPVSLSPKELTAAITGESGRNTLITLQGGGSLNGVTVIVADIVRNPLKGTPRHVDLHKISLTEKVRVEVPINLIGPAIGVKEGGLLDVLRHTLEIECLPTQIPDHIDVDITGLAIGHSIHVNELVVPTGVKVLADAKASLVTVLGKAREGEGAAAAE